MFSSRGRCIEGRWKEQEPQPQRLVLTERGFLFLGRRRAVVCEEGEWCYLDLDSARILMEEETETEADELSRDGA